MTDFVIAAIVIILAFVALIWVTLSSLDRAYRAEQAVESVKVYLDLIASYTYQDQQAAINEGINTFERRQTAGDHQPQDALVWYATSAVIKDQRSLAVAALNVLKERLK